MESNQSTLLIQRNVQVFTGTYFFFQRSADITTQKEHKAKASESNTKIVQK